MLIASIVFSLFPGFVLAIYHLWLLLLLLHFDLFIFLFCCCYYTHWNLSTKNHQATEKDTLDQSEKARRYMLRLKNHDLSDKMNSQFEAHARIMEKAISSHDVNHFHRFAFLEPGATTDDSFSFRGSR